MSFPDLLSVSEAARLLKKSTDFVRDHQVELGRVMLGRNVAFTEAGLLAFLERGGTARAIERHRSLPANGGDEAARIARIARWLAKQNKRRAR